MSKLIVSFVAAAAVALGCGSAGPAPEEPGAPDVSIAPESEPEPDVEPEPKPEPEVPPEPEAPPEPTAKAKSPPPSTQTVEELIPLLASDEDRVWLGAVEDLGELGRAEALAPLMKLLGHDKADVHWKLRKVIVALDEIDHSWALHAKAPRYLRKIAKLFAGYLEIYERHEDNVYLRNIFTICGSKWRMANRNPNAPTSPFGPDTSLVNAEPLGVLKSNVPGKKSEPADETATREQALHVYSELDLIATDIRKELDKLEPGSRRRQVVRAYLWDYLESQILVFPYCDLSGP